jgi:hypothetical protein
MQLDEVFASYSTLIPLCPGNVSVWGLNLVTQSFHSLSPKLQDALHVDATCLSPNLLTLVTCSLQLDALHHLCVAAVGEHALIRNQEKGIAKTVNRKLKQGASTAIAAPFLVHSTPTPRLAPVAVVRLLMMLFHSNLLVHVPSRANHAMSSSTAQALRVSHQPRC